MPLGFNDGYALAMRDDDAERLGIRTLSDLARHPELKLGLSHEFIGRADGWPGLAAALRPAADSRPASTTASPTRRSPAGRSTSSTSTPPTRRSAHLGLAVLDDDRTTSRATTRVVLYRLDVPQRFPAAGRRCSSSPAASTSAR